jgi:hypothetical protein
VKTDRAGRDRLGNGAWYIAATLPFEFHRLISCFKVYSVFLFFDTSVLTLQLGVHRVGDRLSTTLSTLPHCLSRRPPLGPAKKQSFFPWALTLNFWLSYFKRYGCGLDYYSTITT